MSPCSDLDVVGVHAELVGGDLRPDGVVTLAVGRGPDVERHLAGRLASDLRRLPAAGRVPERAQDVRGGQPGHLDVAREPDPDLLDLPALAAGRLLLAVLVVVRELERTLERRQVVGRIDLQPHQRRLRLRVARREADAPDLGRVLADVPRERVDRAFDDVRRLGPPGPADRVGRRLVGHDAGELVPVPLRVVGAHVDPAPELGDPRREELEVRPHVGEFLHPEPQELALLGRRHLDVVDHPATLRRDGVAHRTVLDPLDRSPGPSGEREAERLLRVDVELGAERPTDVGGDDPQLVLGDPGGARQGDPGDVRDLRRGPQGELAHRGHHGGERAPRLDRARRDPRRLVAELKLHGRVVEHTLVAAAAVAPVHHGIGPELVVHEGEPSLAPSSRSRTGVSCSYSTATTSAASSAIPRDSATTTATPSPWNRALSFVMGQ